METRYYIQTRFNESNRWYNIGIGYKNQIDAESEFNRLKEKFFDADFRCVKQVVSTTTIMTTENNE